MRIIAHFSRIKEQNNNYTQSVSHKVSQGRGKLHYYATNQENQLKSHIQVYPLQRPDAESYSICDEEHSCQNNSLPCIRTYVISVRRYHQILPVLIVLVGILRHSQKWHHLIFGNTSPAQRGRSGYSYQRYIFIKLFIIAKQAHYYTDRCSGQLTVSKCPDCGEC